MAILKKKELLEQIDWAIAHHEVVLDNWEDEPKDVFKTKREVKVFLSALEQIRELL